MTTRTTFAYRLTEPQQSALESILRTGNYLPVQTPHTRIAARNAECNIALYQSGKCVVQGQGAADFVAFVLEPLVLQAAALGYEEVLDAEASQPHAGVDESGKGDFFGPLVIAGAYVDPTLAAAMREMHVRDSKQITSDKVALAMGLDLRKLLGNRYALVKIGPRAYNRLYSKLRNVNLILGWAHARAIENLLEKVPDCPRAVSDQFGSKSQVKRALMQKGRRIELVQRHKAESDLAVAAASVIAREIFLRSLKDMERQYGLPMPKGVSPAVKESARNLIETRGPAILLDTAKCHFKTTDEVLKQAGRDRGDLGPEGRAVSRPTRFLPRARRPSPQAEAPAPG